MTGQPRIFVLSVLTLGTLHLSCSNYSPLTVDGASETSDAGGADFIVPNSNDGDLNKTPNSNGSTPTPTPTPKVPTGPTVPSTGGGTTVNPAPTPTLTPIPPVVPPRVIDCNEPELAVRTNVSNAPASYGVASHVISKTYSLGNNTYSPTADKSCKDEDGVIFPEILKYGTTNHIQIITGGSGGSLSVWIDYNGDGTFDQPSEKVFNGGVISHNFISVLFPANPTTKTSVTTWVRFRYGPFGLGYSGVANVGEVEDYQITIEQ